MLLGKRIKEFRTKNNLSAKYADRFGKSVVSAASAARTTERDAGTITVPALSAASAARGNWCKNQFPQRWGWGY